MAGNETVLPQAIKLGFDHGLSSRLLVKGTMTLGTKWTLTPTQCFQHLTHAHNLFHPFYFAATSSPGVPFVMRVPVADQKDHGLGERD